MPENELIITDLESGEKCRFELPKVARPMSVAWHPTENIVAVACLDKLRLWNLNRNEVLHEIPPTRNFGLVVLKRRETRSSVMVKLLMSRPAKSDSDLAGTRLLTGALRFLQTVNISTVNYCATSEITVIRRIISQCLAIASDFRNLRNGIRLWPHCIH